MSIEGKAIERAEWVKGLRDLPTVTEDVYEWKCPESLLTDVAS